MIWNGGSMTHAALSLYLGDSWAGPGQAPAAAVLHNYKHRLRDWWDMKDLTSIGSSVESDNYSYHCATAPLAGQQGQPWCNSHYNRQLIGWAVPAALSGQQFDVESQTLTFAPAIGAPRRLPVFTAAFTGTLDWEAASIMVHSGSVGELRLRLRLRRRWGGAGNDVDCEVSQDV